MSRSRIRILLKLLPVLTASTIVVAGIVYVLSELVTALPTAIAAMLAVAETSLLDSVILVLRGYILRLSIRNTLIVMLAVALAVYLLTRLMLLYKLFDAQRHWLSALMLTPLFLPIPIAAVLWSPLTEPIELITEPHLSLLLITLIQFWRLWPLVLLMQPLVRSLADLRAALLVAMTAAWFVLIDAGTGMIATGGQPNGSTHSWAAWMVHQSLMGLWPVAAVVGIGLMLASALIAVIIWLLSAPSDVKCPPRVEQPLSASQRTIATVAGVTVVALPVIASIIDLLNAPIGRSIVVLVQAGILRWILVSIITLLTTWLTAALIILPGRRAITGKWRWASLFSLALGMASMPLWSVLLGRWEGARWAGGEFLLPALLTGISAGLVGTWLINYIRTDLQPFHQQRYFNKADSLLVFMLAALFRMVQYSQELQLDDGGRWHSVGSGLAQHLLGDAVAAPAWLLASVLTFAAVFVITVGAIRNVPSGEP